MKTRRRLLTALLLCSLCPAAQASGDTCEQSLAMMEKASPEGVEPSRQAMHARDFAMTQNIYPNDKTALFKNGAVNTYFLTLYIQARENYWGSPAANYADYNLVRVFSDQETFAQYQHEIILSNPQSPGARLGNGGTRQVTIAAFKFLDTTHLRQGGVERRYLAQATIKETGPKAAQEKKKLILVEFLFTDLDLSEQDRCFNPLGFRVLYYHVDDAMS